MEIPKLLEARGILKCGVGGGGPAGIQVHREPDPPAGQGPARRLLQFRGRQDGGPGQRRKQARATLRGPDPSPLAPRPDHAGGSSDVSLVVLDPVDGDVEAARTGQAAGTVWREEAAPGPKLQGPLRVLNPVGRPELGSYCASAVPVLSRTAIPTARPEPATAFSGTITIHNQDLLLRFENGVFTLTTPRPPTWEPRVASARQAGDFLLPQLGDPHATQHGDCPELPPDFLLAEPPEPASAPAPVRDEKVEGLVATGSPQGPQHLSRSSSMVLYVCPEMQCGQTFAKKHQLKVHLLTHSSSQGQRPFRCPLGGCGWTFTTSYKLKRHLQSHDKLRPFGCPAEGCGKSFTTVYNLKAHMKGHEQENSFKCEVCEESFPTQTKLSVHQRSHFEPERPYQCAFSGCKKTFITVSALFSHNRAHFREQELFSCSFPGCNKQYDKACRLKIHLRSHTGERPFLCDFDGCGWNFTSMSKLLRHKRKHEDDRRFTCPVEGCGKSFTRAEHLKGHSITHLGTKPFVCPVEGCCARFSARSSLYIHSKKHLQDVDSWKSRCPVSTCNKLFTSKHSMKTHMAKRHTLGQDLIAQLEAGNSLTPSSELTSQGQNELSDADIVSLFSDVPGSSSAAMLDSALVSSGILTIDVASMSSTLTENLPRNHSNTLAQALDPRTLIGTSDLPQNPDTSLFFGAVAGGFLQSTLDMDEVPGKSAGPLGALGSLALKNSSQEIQTLTPSSKLTVDTDILTHSTTLCDNSVSELLMPTKAEWNIHPATDFFEQEEEPPFGFSSPEGNHDSQKETDLITVTGSSFLRSVLAAEMEIPKLLEARGILKCGVGGGGPAGIQVHREPDPPAGQGPARRLLQFRGRQDGGPGQRRKQARATLRGPDPSPLAPRPDHAGGSSDVSLVVLDPVDGDVEAARTGQAAGTVWREEAAPGPKLQGPLRVLNPVGRPELGSYCASAVPVLSRTAIPTARPEPATAFSGTITIHNQDLLLRFENGVFTLTTPRPPTWEPRVASARQAGDFLLPQLGDPHATQHGDCPELPPDFLLAEPPEPASAPAPVRDEKVEGLVATGSPQGPQHLSRSSSMVLYVCPEMQCGQTFAKKHQLKVHLLTHSSSQGQRPFRCPLGGCGWTFTTSYKLKRHLQSHDKLRPFGCPAEGCGKSFTTVYNLKAHMKGHEQENSFKCEVCEESFPTQTKLSVHQRSHFEPERPYQCAFSGCKKTFITVSALFSHNRAHFREQELFSCSFPGCNKQYDKACRLKIHLRSHTGERPFLCDFDGCGWNFTSMSKLLRHKRKHEDDRRFTCPVEGCGKSFTRAEHLKGHSITHLGTKPFVCPVEGCCARFSARSSLYIHSKKHLQDVDSWKSRCPVSTCNKLFTSKHSMKTHMAKRHTLGQDLIAQLEAGNSLTPSSELTSQGQNELSDADIVSLFSDVPGSSSAAMLDSALVSSGILTIDVASMSSTLTENLPRNHSNTLAQALDPRTLIGTSDLPQNPDTSLFFGAVAGGFLQSTLDMDEVPGKSAGPLGALGSLALKNSSQEIQTLTPSSKLTVDTDILTHSTTLCDNSVSELLMPTKAEWNIHPATDFFEQEEEPPFGFSSPEGNHDSQKETDLITVTGSSFLA
ncbi:PREDICTED: uncharacterized protein LOC102864989 [Elephantulus edwardii]|uniref:uncharacterized protein LOC102864989 n=1 Tax=Elephantulus edwardii TaxID=28737 RepID=UPI0003F0EB00|nr:PREDICTED: uncharacterized protein LOC102864989 [Elephantulus edwardii]